jgi:hypothetical protein
MPGVGLFLIGRIEVARICSGNGKLIARYWPAARETSFCHEFGELFAPSLSRPGGELVVVTGGSPVTSASLAMG